MTSAIPFQPNSKISAEMNMVAYIDRARTELSAFGLDLDFDSHAWDVTKYCSSRGDRSGNNQKHRLLFSARQKDGGMPLSSSVRNFAKAYLRSEVSQRTFSVMQQVMGAFRAIDAALAAQNISSICDCDATTFTCAVTILSSKVSPGTVDTIGPQLGVLARFMETHGLCRYPVSMWKYASQSKSSSGRIGPEFDERRRAKLPAQEAL